MIATILKAKKVVSLMFAAGGGPGWESPGVVSGARLRSVFLGGLPCGTLACGLKIREYSLKFNNYKTEHLDLTTFRSYIKSEL